MLNLENDKIDNKNETFESEELQAFLSISRNLDSGGITGAEYYPGELIAPIRKDVKLSENQLDLLIEYYNRAYVDYNFSRSRLDPSSSSENYIAVTGKITQCGRLRIGAEYFRSTLSKRHIRSSYTLARFIINKHNNNIDTYPSQVQFYFEHIVHIPSKGSKKHYLAFIN